MKAVTGVRSISSFSVSSASGWEVSLHARERDDVDMGAIPRQKHTLPIFPILSTLSLVAGVGLVVVGVRSREEK